MMNNSSLFLSIIILQFLAVLFIATATPKETDYDVIVIGAGIIGSAIAYKMALDGKRTLLLEKEELCHDHGSSHGASRIIRYMHSNEMWLPLMHDSFKEWEQLEKKTGKEGKLLIQNGLLTMEMDEKATRNREEVLKKYGLEAHVWRGMEVTAHFPHLQNYGEDWWALYEPSGGTLVANECLQTIQEQFKNEGGRIQEKNEVVGIDHHADHVVVHANANTKRDVHGNVRKHVYTAKWVVVAAGPWLNTLLNDLQVTTYPQQMSSYFWEVSDETAKKFYNPYPNANKEGQNALPLHPSPTLLITNPNVDEDELEELYAIPGVDYPGVIKFNIHKGTRIEGTIPKNQERQTASWTMEIPRKHIEEHLPGVNVRKPSKSTTCLYTMTPDEMFIVDSHPQKANIFIAGGFSGTGFKFALTIGKLMVQMVNKQKSLKITGFDGNETTFDHIEEFSAKREAVHEKVKLR